jgi:hypothetical protein
MFRADHELLLAESWGYLEILDLKTSNLTSTHEFKEGGSIHDVLPLDGSHYLLATFRGLLKTTTDQLVSHYF